MSPGLVGLLLSHPPPRGLLQGQGPHRKPHRHKVVPETRPREALAIGHGDSWDYKSETAAYRRPGS